MQDVEIMQSERARKRDRGYYRRREARNRWAFVLLVAPALLWFLTLMVWPIANMFYVSTLRWRGLVAPKEWIGLANYVRMFSGDPRFVRALLNTGRHLIVGLPVVMVTAFMLGFFLSQRRPGYRVFRTIFFSPTMISAAGIALMFLGIYMPDGIINSLLRTVGLGELARPWLGDSSTAMPAVIAADIWASIGYQSVLFFSILSSIPSELYEAARIDGATYWTVMWRIAFPLSLDFFGLAAMLRTLWILMGSAQFVLLLTEGGPGDHSLTLGYYLYSEAFLCQRLGYSQALGVFIFALGIACILLIRRMTRRSWST